MLPSSQCTLLVVCTLVSLVHGSAIKGYQHVHQRDEPRSIKSSPANNLDRQYASRATGQHYTAPVYESARPVSNVPVLESTKGLYNEELLRRQQQQKQLYNPANVRSSVSPGEENRQQVVAAASLVPVAPEGVAPSSHQIVPPHVFRSVSSQEESHASPVVVVAHEQSLSAPISPVVPVQEPVVKVHEAVAPGVPQQAPVVPVSVEQVAADSPIVARRQDQAIASPPIVPVSSPADPVVPVAPIAPIAPVVPAASPVVSAASPVDPVASPVAQVAPVVSPVVPVAPVASPVAPVVEPAVVVAPVAAPVAAPVVPYVAEQSQSAPVQSVQQPQVQQVSPVIMKSAEDALFLKKDEFGDSPIEVPAPDPGLVLSEPIDSMTKLLIDLDEHVQKFLPIEEQHQPQPNMNHNLVAGIDYPSASATSAAKDSLANAPLTPYSGNDDPIVPPLPSLVGVEQASPASAVAVVASAASSSSPSSSSSSTRQGQPQNQQQVINQLLDQLDALQARIQDTINQLVARRRYVLSAVLRPMGTYVRRVRTNLERLQNRVSALQAAASTVGGPGNRPGGFVDAAAIETIRRRIDDISKRISDIINRIRFSLTPTSAPMNNGK